MKERNYYGFSDWLDIKSNFEDKIGDEPELVYAVYSTPSYEGSADIVFRRNGEWFQAGGGHCSCYGLEDQWEPTSYDPTDHLNALSQGKRLSLIYDTEGDYPEATPEAFDEWLHWAVLQP